MFLHIRLTCVKYTTSVHSEPGSNSHYKYTLKLLKSIKKYTFKINMINFLLYYIIRKTNKKIILYKKIKISKSFSMFIGTLIHNIRIFCKFI